MKSSKAVACLISLFILLFTLISCTDEPENIVVNFYLEGGIDLTGEITEDYRLDVNKGDLLNLPNELTKDGYLFGGWLNDGQPWIFSLYQVNQSVDLKASWVPENGTYLKYNVNGEIIRLVDYHQASEITINVKNHQYWGWFYDVAFNQKVTFPVDLDTTTEIYAKLTTDLLSDNLTFTLNSTKDGYILSKYSGSSNWVNVTDTYNGLPVVEVEEWAFYGSHELARVNLPDTVKKIGRKAFADCFKLNFFKCPEDLEVIAQGAFMSCFDLKEVIFNQKITMIESNAFYYCTSLKTIELGANLNYLGTWSLYALNDLESITIDPSNQYFVSLDGVLYDKDMTSVILYPSQKKDREYLMPNTVTIINQWSVSNNPFLENITLSTNLKHIESYAFSYCPLLKTITLPKSVMICEENVFYGFSELEIILDPDIDLSQFKNNWNQDDLTGQWYQYRY